MEPDEAERERLLQEILSGTSFAEDLAAASEMTEPRYLVYLIDEEEEQ
jgi:hypothetical protein